MHKVEREALERVGMVVVRLPDVPGFNASETTVRRELVDDLVERGVLHRNGDDLWVTDKEAFEAARLELWRGCDFCTGAVAASWLYRVIHGAILKTVLHGEGTTSHVDDSDWLACGDCADLIEKNDRHALAGRCATAAAKSIPRRITPSETLMLAAAAMDAHASFFERRVGERIPL